MHFMTMLTCVSSPFALHTMIVCSRCHALDLQTEGKRVVFVACLRVPVGEAADSTIMPYSPGLQVCHLS